MQKIQIRFSPNSDVKKIADQILPNSVEEENMPQKEDKSNNDHVFDRPDSPFINTSN